MGDLKIKKMIKSFFENDVSKELRLQFYHWFVGASNYSSTNEEMMLELWENTSSESDNSVLEQLKKVQQAIDIIEQPTVKSIPFYKKMLKVAAIMILPILASGITYLAFNKSSDTAELDLEESYSPIGEVKKVTLADGSEVSLKEGTLLIYPKTFNGDKRDIFLSGEANFSVAKNPKMPFTVRTQFLGVTALGTVFNVNAYPDSKEVTTTLEEGKVRVKSLGNGNLNEIIYPDEQIVYNDLTESYVKNIVNSRQLAQATKGVLLFQGETFDTIIKSLETRYGVVINYEDGRFVGRRLTVKFSADETLENSLSILSQMIPGIHYKIINKEVYIN